MGKKLKQKRRRKKTSGASKVDPKANTEPRGIHLDCSGVSSPIVSVPLQFLNNCKYNVISLQKEYKNHSDPHLCFRVCGRRAQDCCRWI